MSEVNLEKIRKIDKKLKALPTSAFPEYPKFKPTEGDNIIRTLPPAEGKDMPFKMLCWHRVGDRSFLCPKILDNDKCPICESIEILKQSNIQEHRDLAFSWSAPLIGAFNIIDRVDSEAKIWTSSPKMYKDIINLIATWDTSSGYSGPLFTDPYKGRDLNLKMEMVRSKGRDKKLRPSYNLLVLDPSPITTSKKEMKAILDNIIDLDDAYKSLGYDRVKEMFDDIIEEVLEEGEIKPEKKQEKEEEPSDDGLKRPKCFGKEYDSKDEECQECPHKKECSETGKQEEPVVEEPEKEEKEEKEPKEKEEKQGKPDRTKSILERLRGKKA